MTLSLDARLAEAHDELSRELQRVVGSSLMADILDRLVDRFANGQMDAEAFRSVLDQASIPVDAVLDQAITVLAEVTEELAERDYDSRYDMDWSGGFAENH